MYRTALRSVSRRDLFVKMKVYNHTFYNAKLSGVLSLSENQLKLQKHRT